MRKLLLFVCGILLAGCKDNTSPADAVVVTAATSVTSIKAQEVVSIELTVYNRGDETITFAPSECFPPFDVLNSSGEVVGPGPRMCTLSTLSLLAPIDVAPGTTARYTTSWDGSAAYLGPADGVTYLPPGSYTIRPRITLFGEGDEFVYGNPVAITITQ